MYTLEEVKAEIQNNQPNLANKFTAAAVMSTQSEDDEYDGIYKDLPQSVKDDENLMVIVTAMGEAVVPRVIELANQ